MAEQVQAILDAMVAPLANLRDRQIFTPEEISATVDRRRESEYRLQRRRQPRLSDYLEYIAVEEKLEQLRRVRLNKQQRQNRNKNKKQKDDDEQNLNRQGDTHIQRHIHFIWTRTLACFGKQNYELYEAHAASCRRRQASHSMWTTALRFHGATEPRAWLGAAQHEMVDNNAVGAARIVLQRGLRVLKTKTWPLWRASFVLELHAVQKMWGRRAVLGIEKQEDGDPFELAKIVYRNAVKAGTENDPLWGWKLLEACDGFPVDALEAWILGQLEQQEIDNPDVWVARIQYFNKKQQKNEGNPAKRRKLEDESSSGKDSSGGDDNDDDDSSNLVLHTIRKACNAVPKPDMYEKVVAFLDEYIDNNNDTEASALARSLLQELLKEVSQETTLQTPSLMLQYAETLSEHDAAVAVLSQYAKRAQQHGGCDVSLWLTWAQRLYKLKGPAEAVSLLETAPIAMADPQFIVLQVQILGLQMFLGDSDQQWETLQRITLLAPANPMAICDRSVHPECTDLPSACVAFLQQERLSVSIRKAATNTILSIQERSWKTWVDQAPDCVWEIVLIAVAATKHPRFVYDKAIERCQGTTLAKRLRLHRDETHRFRHGSMSVGTIPIVDMQHYENDTAAWKRVSELYGRYQVCLLKNVKPNGSAFDWKALTGLFSKLDAADRESWSVETPGSSSSTEIDPAVFLSKEQQRGYCSFLVQKDRSAYAKLIEQGLPVTGLHPEWNYDDAPAAVWFFFGWNKSSDATLPGRPEHTDAVSHDGTWHYQLAGRKRWHLRPTSELQQQQQKKEGIAASGSCTVTCSQGDVLVLNTRLWWHRTELPPGLVPSVSYARDFLLASPAHKRREDEKSDMMTNVEGTYATEDIEEGTIIFTENDMPDMELHRSKVEGDANCQVCEFEDGTSAVVSVRMIRSGEFFCVPETDEESDDESASLVLEGGDE